MATPKFIEALKAWSDKHDKKVNIDQVEKDLSDDVEVEKASDSSEKTFIKEFKKEERISVEILIEPDSVDAHGDWCSAETIQKGKESFDRSIENGTMSMNLFHLKDVGEDQLVLKDNYILPCDCVIGETEVKKGTWCCEIFWQNEELWKRRTTLLKGEDGNEYTEIAGLSYKGWGDYIIEEQEDA